MSLEPCEVPELDADAAVLQPAPSVLPLYKPAHEGKER